MAAETVTMRGVVKGGVIVPDKEILLPEGTAVGIVYHIHPLPAEFQHEFQAWDRAGANAWAMIDEWETEAHP